MHALHAISPPNPLAGDVPHFTGLAATWHVIPLLYFTLLVWTSAHYTRLRWGALNLSLLYCTLSLHLINF